MAKTNKKTKKEQAELKDQAQPKQEKDSKEKAQASTKKKPKKSTKKSTKSAKTKKTGKKPETMAELLAATGYEPVIPQVGKKVKGTITLKTDKLITVDINSKTQAVVADSDFNFAKNYIEDLEEGDEIEAMVLTLDNGHGQIALSLKSAAYDAKWEYFEEALEKEAELTAKGLESNKGGLIVLINSVHGFVPSSQFSRKYVGKIDQLIGQTFKVKAIEVDREKNRLIFSERHVSEAKQLAQREQALDVVQEGEVYEGVVSGVKSFGLFMTVEIPVEEPAKDQDKVAKEDIGYVEGLIHISEISWEKVDHPRNYHQVGDRIKVKVLGVDEDSGKLNLSIKRLTQDPWEKAAKEYPVGTTFTGTVSRLEPFGAFVNVMPGVDGLIHSSKLDPNANLKLDDEVTVNVDSIEPEKRRMSLSMVLTEVPVGYK